VLDHQPCTFFETIACGSVRRSTQAVIDAIRSQIRVEADLYRQLQFNMKLSTATLGFPRMGPNRELKFALEKHWKGLIGKDELFQVAHDVEEQGWTQQKQAGIDRITVGDFYLYDGVLAWNEMIGFVPKRFGSFAQGTDRLFAMARGVDGATALSTYKHRRLCTCCSHCQDATQL
jgi:Cobalamin-independent synthase, N-terminal domain